MTKISLILLLITLSACGPAFTSSDLALGTGEGGEAPVAAGAPSAGIAGLSQAGAPSTAGAGGNATSDAGFGGGLPQPAPPCSHAADTVSPGYLALGLGCSRTKETFDTIYCGGHAWADRTIKVNGVLAECNKTQVFAPMIGGYNYFDIEGAPAGGDWLRWGIAGAPQACWQLFARDQCADYQVGDAVSYNGQNWICSSPDCSMCGADSRCSPSGACGAALWTSEGSCE